MSTKETTSKNRGRNGGRNSGKGSSSQRPTIVINLPYGLLRTLLAGVAATLFPWLIIMGILSIVFVTTQTNAWLMETTWNDVASTASSIWASGYAVPIVTGIGDDTWLVSLIPLGLSIAYIWLISLLARQWRGHTLVLMWYVVPAHVSTALVLTVASEHDFSLKRLALGTFIISILGVLHAMQKLLEDARKVLASEDTATTLSAHDRKNGSRLASSSDDDFDTSSIKLEDYINEAEEERLRQSASSERAAEAAIAAARAVRRSEYIRHKKREAEQQKQAREKEKNKTKKTKRIFQRKTKPARSRPWDVVRDLKGWDGALRLEEHDLSLGIDLDERTIRIGNHVLVIPGWIISGLLVARNVIRTGAFIALIAVIVTSAMHLDDIQSITSLLKPGILGGIVLFIAHLCYLPTFMTYAMVWLMGPGFQPTANSAVTPFKNHVGNIPALPAYGIVPESTPGLVVVLLPIILGFMAGILMYMTKARANYLRHLGSSVVAALTITGVFTLIVWLSTGAIGPRQLSHIGPDPIDALKVTFLEIGLPIIVVMAVGHPTFRKLLRPNRAVEQTKEEPPSKSRKVNTRNRNFDEDDTIDIDTATQEYRYDQVEAEPPTDSLTQVLPQTKATEDSEG